MARPTKPTPARVSRETARHLEAFEAWYAAGRNWSIVAQNRSISRSLLYSWADKFNWNERADERDGKAQKIADAKAVQEQATRLKRQRQAGELMQERGVKYLRENDIKHERTAIAAIKTGIDVQRQADGLPDWVIHLLNADANELEKQRAELDARRRAAMAHGQSPIGDVGRNASEL